MHQLLHGYDSGHTLLAASRQLDEMSVALVGLLSDLAPAAQEAPEDGWLSIYPVVEADLFAVARTWPAPEMARPGCVWTHTILLSYGQLANLVSLQQVLALHQKPVNGAFESFRNALQLPTKQLPKRIAPVEYQAARQLLRAIYDSNQAIVGVAEQPLAEKLLTALWDQQWPRLRRRFRGCSICVREAGMGNWRFDLMFARDRSELRDLAAKPRVIELRHGEKSGRPPGWVTAALADLRNGGSLFRAELRSLAADINSGRRAFPILSSIIALGDHPHPSDIGDLVSSFRQRVGEEEGYDARLMLAQAVIEHPQGLQESVLKFGVEQLANLPSDQNLDKFARELWRTSKLSFWTTLAPLGNARAAYEALLRTIGLDELVDALGRPHAKIDDAILLRPELAGLPATWSSHGAIAAHVIELAKENTAIRLQALRGVLTARAEPAAEELMSYATGSELFDTLSNTGPAREWTSFEIRWLRKGMEDLRATETYLASNGVRREALPIIARRMGLGGFAPAQGAPDIWYAAWKRAEGEITGPDAQYLQAFLLVRALRYRSSDRAQMLASVYEPVARALSSGTARDEVVDLLDSQIPGDFSWLWFETRTTKIRRGVAKALVTSNIPLAPTIAAISIEAAKYLVKSLADVNGGPAQLRAARQALTTSKATQGRLQIIDDQLKPKRK